MGGRSAESHRAAQLRPVRPGLGSRPRPVRLEPASRPPPVRPRRAGQPQWVWQTRAPRRSPTGPSARTRSLAEARSSSGSHRVDRPPHKGSAAGLPGRAARTDPAPLGPESAARPHPSPTESRRAGSVPAAGRLPGSERRPEPMEGSAAPERAVGRRPGGPAQPAGRIAPPESRPKPRNHPAVATAGPAATGRLFDPGGASPPSPAPARAIPASGRPASPAGCHEPRLRPDPGSWPDPDRPRSRLPPGHGPRPAARASSCRSSHRRAERWSLHAAARPVRGSNPELENRWVSLDRSASPAAPARQADRQDRVPGSVAGPQPMPPRPRRPSAELPHPSVPGGSPEQTRRSGEGWSWDTYNRTYVLPVKPAPLPGLVRSDPSTSGSAWRAGHSGQIPTAVA